MCDINNMVQIELLNDFQQQLIPFLQIHFNKVQLIYQSNENQKMLRSFISLSSHYFNFYGGDWEPFMEDTSFTFDLGLNKNSNPQMLVALELSEN